MKNFYFFIVLLLCVVFVPKAVAQNISNEGTEFWTVFPTHDPNGGSLATMNVNITSKGNSRVTVSCGSYSETKAIPANTVVTFLVPRAQSYIDYTDGNKILTNRGIHIVVAPGNAKVVAYSHVFASARSAATLILPYDALGQKYFSMNYFQDEAMQSARNFLTLVAVEDKTDVIIRDAKGGVIETVKLLKAGDVYEYLPTSYNVDLTGVYVEADPTTSSCKRFAAFSGSTSVGIVCTNGRDPLLQQLYSVNSWGKVYGVVPFINRQYIIRVLAQEDNTAVRLNGAQVRVLNKGEYYEASLFAPTIVSADKLISVAEYSLSQNCSSLTGQTMLGDPEMVLLNPIEFNIKNITVFSSNNFRILEKYINVFMKTAKTSTFRINGSMPANGVWQPMPSDPTYSYIQIQVYDESINLTADDGFNAIAYGFGQTESYAYSAGTNLAASQFLELVNNVSNTVNTSACISQETNFKLTLPYLITKITWKYNDGTPDFIDNSPTYTTSVVNGQTLYTYTSPARKIFTAIGTTSVSAVAILANTTSSCITGQLDLNFPVEVNALAAPNFDIPTDICAGAEIKFFDRSIAGGNTITQWKWDFDGTIKTEKDPVFIFTTAKTYKVKLSVANASGCWSDVLSKDIVVRKYLPVIVFNALDPICINAPKKQFGASETLGLTAANKVFSGDGVSATGLFDPAAAGAGVHKITYTFTSTDGCINTATQDIEVYALPKISIEPEIYILSGGQKTIPTVVANPNAKFRYKWTPATGLDKDNVQNPIASPDKDTEYTLSVTVDGMCEVTTKVLVKVLGEINPPNSFSPNGDGINDIWNIRSIDSYPDALVQVFNRNGQKVFSSVGYTVPFDGTYHNERLPVGVYYYVITPKNGRKAITGPLTIIR